MKRSDTSNGKAARETASRHGRLVVSFVDRNRLWSRFGLALSLILAVVIGALALMPLPALDTAPAGLDKIYYFLAFFVLVFPVIVTDPNRWTLAVPAAIVFGGAIEMFQPLIGRSADWLDFGASISGVLAGAGAAEILHNRIRRSVLGDEPDLRTNVPLASEHDRLEAMRGELMAELRAVLREELEAAAQRGVGIQSVKPQAPEESVSDASAPATPQTAQPQPARPASAPAPARVTPVRLKESAELRRAKIALRARDPLYDPLSGASDADMPRPPPVHPPRGTSPDGGASARH